MKQEDWSEFTAQMGALDFSSGSTIRVSASSLNMRHCPGTSCSVKTTLSQNDVGEIRSHVDNGTDQGGRLRQGREPRYSLQPHYRRRKHGVDGADSLERLPPDLGLEFPGGLPSHPAAPAYRQSHTHAGSHRTAGHSHPPARQYAHASADRSPRYSHTARGGDNGMFRQF